MENVLVILVSGLIGYIIGAFALYKMLQKANYDHPIWAWIPFFNALAQHDITFGKGLRNWVYGVLGVSLVTGAFGSVENGLIVTLIGLLNIALFVYYVIWTWKLYKAFGASTLMAILGFIPLINIIVLYVLAFSDKHQYLGMRTHPFAK